MGSRRSATRHGGWRQCRGLVEEARRPPRRWRGESMVEFSGGTVTRPGEKRALVASMAHQVPATVWRHSRSSPFTHASAGPDRTVPLCACCAPMVSKPRSIPVAPFDARGRRGLSQVASSDCLSFQGPEAVRRVDTRELRLLQSLPAHRGPLAQLVEHRTFNPMVAGSSPARLTSRKPIIRRAFLAVRVASFLSA